MRLLERQVFQQQVTARAEGLSHQDSQKPQQTHPRRRAIPSVLVFAEAVQLLLRPHSSACGRPLVDRTVALCAASRTHTIEVAVAIEDQVPGRVAERSEVADRL